MKISNRLTRITLALGNFPTGGSIGTAVSTVDIASSIAIAQTTAGQTLTVAIPSVPDNGVDVIIKNSGTADFTLLGMKVRVGKFIQLVLQGGAWTLDSSLSNAWSLTGNAGTTATTYNDSTPQTNSFAGTTDNVAFKTYTNAGANNAKAFTTLFTSTPVTQAVGTAVSIFEVGRNGQTGVMLPQILQFKLGRHTNTASIAPLTQAIISVSNNAATADVDVMTLRGDGNVGIGTTTPLTRFEVKASAFAGNIYVARFGQTSTKIGNSSMVGLGTEGVVFSKIAIGHVRTGAFDVGDMVFALNTNAGAGTDATLEDERMRLTSTGRLGIGTTAPISTLQANGSFATTTALIGAFPFTATLAHHKLMINVNASGVINIPTAGGNAGLEYHIYFNENITALQTATITPAGGSTIGNPLTGAQAATLAMTSTGLKMIKIVSDGINWHTALYSTAGASVPTTNAQTGTTYTTLATDSGNIVTLNNAAAITVTLSNLTAGTITEFVQLGAGVVTFVTGTLTRQNVAFLFSTAGQYSRVSAYVNGTNCILSGDLS